MFFSTDQATIAHGIQLAIAPVFLLTAVAGMISTVAGRLARIIDRARIVEQRLEEAHQGVANEAGYKELDRLRLRGRLVNASIALLTFCALLIGVTIMVLFLGETTSLEFLRLSTLSFLSGVICFLLALLCFLAETLLASRILKFARPTSQPSQK
jgi:hypothetical protein